MITHEASTFPPGTLSAADCITDLLYEPAGLDGCVLGAPPGSAAHSGVLASARAVITELRRTGALRAAMASADVDGWRLVVTGHSLGAGVATLVGLMLRAEYPTLRVWAFSPPGGLLTQALAEASSEWCAVSVCSSGNPMSLAPMTNSCF